MVVQSLRIGLLKVLPLTLALLAARSASAAVSSVEDLTGCKLQNGRAVLPVAGSLSATNGPMYKFLKNEFSAIPTGPDGKSVAPDEAQARVRESRAADILYLPERGGSLWAISGAISEVAGAQSLSELAGKKLDEPGLIPKTSQNLAGQCLGLHDGGVYLLKTTDGRYVLLRVLEKSATAAVIQYVYQADGGTTFDIPLNPPMAYQRPMEAEPPAPPTAPAAPSVAAAPGLPGNSTAALPTANPQNPRLLVSASPVEHPKLGPGDINEPGVIRIISDSPRTTGLEPTIDTFANQRNQMLQRRMDLINEPARSPVEIQRKAQAVADLSALHPDEPVIADLLVREIAFSLPASQVKEISPEAMLPCFAALKNMGKSATNAALKGIRNLDMDASGEGIGSPTSKAKLLGMVIRSVEGDDLANFILRRELEHETDAKHRAALEFVLQQ